MGWEVAGVACATPLGKGPMPPGSFCQRNVGCLISSLATTKHSQTGLLIHTSQPHSHAELLKWEEQEQQLTYANVSSLIGDTHPQGSQSGLDKLHRGK